MIISFAAHINPAKSVFVIHVCLTLPLYNRYNNTYSYKLNRNQMNLKLTILKLRTQNKSNFFIQFLLIASFTYSCVAKKSSKYIDWLLLPCRDVRLYTDIQKISVLNSISVYRCDFFSYTDVPKFPICHSVYRNL